MDKTEIIGKIKLFSDALKIHFSVRKVILFGSYAKGTARLDSDIDVAVIVEKNDMDFFQYAPLLWKIAGNIDSLIEPILFVENQKDSSGLMDDILKNGIRVV